MAHHDDDDVKPESVAEAVTEMKLETENSPDNATINDIPPSEGTKDITEEPKSTPQSASPKSEKNESKSRSQSRSPIKEDGEPEEKVGGEITVKLEPGQPPKLARTSSQKISPRPVQLYNDYPDKTQEAKESFQLMEECTYANKYMGYTEHAMECDCAEEWGKFISFVYIICPQNTRYDRMNFVARNVLFITDFSHTSALVTIAIMYLVFIIYSLFFFPVFLRT